MSRNPRDHQAHRRLQTRCRNFDAKVVILRPPFTWVSAFWNHSGAFYSFIAQGMPVLAKFCGNRSQFHPARVLEFSDTHATLRFWDDAKIHVNRWSLLTLECPQIAHVDIAAEVYQATAVSESFVSEELTTGLRAIHSALVSLMQDDPSTTDSVVGSDSKKKKRKAEKGEAENKESSRRQDFFAGGKRRQRLAQRIGRGPFTKNEYYFILRRLHQLFPFKRPAAQVESSDTTIKPTTKTINTTLFTNESEYRQFIGSVLWPEAIIRLIQWRHANQHADEPPLTLMECEERMMRGTHLPTDTNNVNSDEDNLVEETELKWLDEFLSLIEMYQTAARGAHR